MTTRAPNLIPGEKTVTTAGAAVPLVAASLIVSGIAIVAKSTNTGKIYVGGQGVDNTVNDGLAAGKGLNINPKTHLDLALVYIDADTNGEGVDFWAVPS